MIFTVNCDVIICFNCLIALNIHYIHFFSWLEWQLYSKLGHIFEERVLESQAPKCLKCQNNTEILTLRTLPHPPLTRHQSHVHLHSFSSSHCIQKRGQKNSFKIGCYQITQNSVTQSHFCYDEKKDDGLSDAIEHFWTKTARKSHKLDFVVNCQLSNFS